MSDRRPGIIAKLIFDPPNYDGQPIPRALVNDLADWCAERNLMGSFKRVEWDDDGELVKKP